MNKILISLLIIALIVSGCSTDGLELAENRNSNFLLDSVLIDTTFNDTIVIDTTVIDTTFNDTITIDTIYSGTLSIN